MARSKRKDRTPLLLKGNSSNDKSSDAQTPQTDGIGKSINNNDNREKNNKRRSSWFRFGRGKKNLEYSGLSCPLANQTSPRLLSNKEFSPLHMDVNKLDENNNRNNNDNERAFFPEHFNSSNASDVQVHNKKFNKKTKDLEKSKVTSGGTQKKRNLAARLTHQRLSEGISSTKRMSVGSMPTTGEDYSAPMQIQQATADFLPVPVNTPANSSFAPASITSITDNDFKLSANATTVSPDASISTQSSENDTFHAFEESSKTETRTETSFADMDKSKSFKTTSTITTQKQKQNIKKEKKITKGQLSESSSTATIATTVTTSESSSLLALKQTNSNSNLSPLQTKALLSRPFGRTTLPATIGRKWVVEVSPAEWDNTENCWKYRIVLQHRQLSSSQPTKHEPALPDHKSFTSACAWRSLESFCRLEEDLRQEFSGALLLPLLNISLGTPDPKLVSHEVDSSLLRDWLSDVMNGIRGQGEMVLDHQSADIISSEAMEAFLYQNDGATNDQHYINPEESDPAVLMQLSRANASKLSTLYSHSNKKSTIDKTKYQQDASFVQTLITAGKIPFSLIGMDAVCGGFNDEDQSETSSQESETLDPIHVPTNCDPLACSVRMNGTVHVQDILADIQIPDREKISSILKKSCRAESIPYFHMDLLQAQKELSLSHRRTAMSVMEKLQSLMDEEVQIGLAWKRFAIAISNLFAYEKDVETARLGDKKINRENMPYRKINKGTVDECLRVMARQKLDRAVPSLKALNGMLVAYVADLSAVNPSVDDFFEAMYRFTILDEKLTHIQHQNRERQLQQEEEEEKMINNWQNQIRGAILEVAGGQDCHLIDRRNKLEQQEKNCKSLVKQEKAVRAKLVNNGSMLKTSLTALCKMTTVRVARMAWTYFHSEVSQCALIHSAALSLRTKIDVANKEAVARMISRHHEEEKQDASTELALVQRIVNLGTHKRFPIVPPNCGFLNGGQGVVEVDSDDHREEQSRAALRDMALQLTRKRVGRWDEKMAVAIMKAVGSDDPNIRIEETTRELRMVRKYAIGLRENLNRCIDAVKQLRQCILNEKHDTQYQQQTPTTSCASVPSMEEGKPRHINETRTGFLTEAAKLFSGTFIPRNDCSKLSKTSIRALENAGIFTNDPMGWSSVYLENRRNQNAKNDNEKQGRCGQAAAAYLKSRDSQVEWLFKSLEDLLNDYNERIQTVETHVYMDCVGIQLEKHFSTKRAEALADFEKKTDITTAINVATRKRIPGLVQELKAKLECIDPSVTHTSVKEAKETHLESKQIKLELHELALRRLLRARETSTERVVSIISLWAREEESMATSELKALGDAMSALESAVSKENIGTYMYRVVK